MIVDGKCIYDNYAESIIIEIRAVKLFSSNYRKQIELFYADSFPFFVQFILTDGFIEKEFR